MNTHCPNLANQLGVVHIIKEAFDVKFNHLSKVADLHQSIAFCDCVFHRPLRAEPVAMFAEFCLTNRLHDLLDALLHQPVPHTWDTKGSGRTVGLWNVFASYRPRPVAIGAACDDEACLFNDFFRREPSNVVDGYVVRSTGFAAFIRLDVPVCQQDIFSAENNTGLFAKSPLP